MPQMMPMNWMMMFVLLLSIMSMMMVIIYPTKNLLPQKEKTTFKIYYQWTW